jgi:hypothetical protein
MSSGWVWCECNLVNQLDYGPGWYSRQVFEVKNRQFRLNSGYLKTYECFFHNLYHPNNLLFTKLEIWWTYYVRGVVQSRN